jgi:hypothetical protein
VEELMEKLRLELDGLKVESFEPDTTAAGRGTVLGHDESCSMQRTCGAASRGEEMFEQVALTRYACCV